MNDPGQLMFANSQPFVSAIMPTYGRPALIGESVAMFLNQDYQNKELVILNDCVGQQFHFDHPAVTIVNLPMRFPSLGQKRNACIEIARGEVIAVWDDDDVYLPWRLSYSVEQMRKQATPFYRPADFWAYWGEKNLHHNQSVPYWPNHPFVSFTKEIWKRVGGYPAQDLCEDTAFFERIHNLLRESFIKFPIARVERFGVLRGSSPYEHMSISGGKNQLDTTPGNYHVQATEVVDPCLKDVVIDLTEKYKSRHPILRSSQQTASQQTVPSTQGAPPILSVCVSLKNRSRIVFEGRRLELFPNCVQSLVAAAKNLSPGVVELIVADFASDDWPLQEWIDAAATGIKLKVITLASDFSKGRGLNAAVSQASSNRLLLLDADMLITIELLLSGIKCIDHHVAFFPIFRYLDVDGNTLELETRSYGNAFVSLDQFHAVQGILEFKSWGGEDEVFFERISDLAAIERLEIAGFQHQWHPDYSRHENYLHPAHSDFGRHLEQASRFP